MPLYAKVVVFRAFKPVIRKPFRRCFIEFSRQFAFGISQFIELLLQGSPSRNTHNLKLETLI